MVRVRRSSRYYIYRAGLVATVVVFVLGVYWLTANNGFAPTERPAQALYSLRLEAARDGWTPERHWLAGELYARVDDMASAASHWAAAEPKQPERLRQLASAYLELESWAQAQDVLRELAESTPEQAWAHYHLGLMLAPSSPLEAQDHLEAAAQSRAYEAVANDLLDVLRTKADDPALGMHVGRVLFAHEMWPQAERAFRDAAMRGASAPRAMAYAGLTRERQDKDGLSWIDRALALGGSQDSQVHYLHGLVLREHNRLDASLEAFRKTVQLDPGNPAYYAELGTAYQLIADYAPAEYWLRTAYSLSGQDVRFGEMLTRFYAETGYAPPDPAGETLTTLGDSLPNDPKLLAGLGWALHTSGNTSRALDTLSSALDYTPTSDIALYYKAQILLEQGDQAAAESLLRRLADLDSPYKTWAQTALGRLDGTESTVEPLPVPSRR